MPGYEVTKPDLDRRMGSAVVNLREAFNQIDRINDYLERLTAEDLTAMGYVAEDIPVIKSAFADLTTLRHVAHGEVVAPATATDFFAWGSRLTGLE